MSSICIDFKPEEGGETPFVIRIFGTDEVITKTDRQGMEDFMKDVMREVANARAEQQDFAMKNVFGGSAE